MLFERDLWQAGNLRVYGRLADVLPSPSPTPTPTPTPSTICRYNPITEGQIFPR